MSFLRVCVPKLLSDEQKADAVSFAVSENPDNRQGVGDANGEQLAVEVGKMWANGRSLHVRFLNGDDTQKMKCEREAHKWEQFANIKFVFDNSADAELRVAFYDGNKYTDQGSWSYIGTDCFVAPKDTQTLNFGWLDKSTDDGEWQRVVVHEFGHALGLIHEDQQPAENIQWDKKAVYSYFEGPPNNWTKDDVDNNVLNPTPASGVAHTDFDPSSIMAYQIPPQFTLDGKGVSGGSTLSEKDKAFISKIYPLPSANVVVPGNPAIEGDVSSSITTNEYSLPIPEGGLYRVWTSFINGFVNVYGPDGYGVAHGIQQVIFPAKKGQYKIVVSPQKVGISTQYRIVAKKVK